MKMTIKMKDIFDLPVMPRDLALGLTHELRVAAKTAINAYDANQLEIAELKLALKQNDDEIKNSESVRASISALTNARVNGLINESDELKSMVNALKGGVTHFNRSHGDLNPLLKAYTETPAQCLASANQQAIKDAIFNSEKVEFEGSHYVGTYVSLEDLEVNIKQLGDE